MTDVKKWNAFVPGEKFLMEGQANGPLSGLTMTVKDLFDVAGHPTGAGNSDWLLSHGVHHAAGGDRRQSLGFVVAGESSQ